MADELSLTELGDGVYAWLLPGGETGVANAGVVVDDDGITVIDTLMVRSQWEPFATAVAALGRPVRRTVSMVGNRGARISRAEASARSACAPFPAEVTATTVT